MTGNFGFDTNWLGDAGFSGNPLPGQPLVFKVIVPVNTNLVVVVNNNGSGNVGVGDSFHLTVEGFDQPVATPEPATVGLFGIGLISTLVLKRRRLRAPN